MSVEKVLEFVCKQKAVSREDIFSRSQKKDLWYARYMAWHYIHYEIGWSASKLSKFFNRNVPSIFRGIRLLKSQMLYHKEVRLEYEALMNEMRGADS